jgi:2,3-bisphosphoglycerate-independent phosphoglycerate mutase
MEAGSDTAILSILGYDPARYYTGRGPLEAMGMSVLFDQDAIAFRCNFITEEEGKIVDYSGGHITTEEAIELIKALNEELSDKIGVSETIEFYPGVSYRNILLLRSGSKKEIETECTPPHEIIGSSIEKNLPKEGLLRSIVLTSTEILENQEINLKRAKENKKKANMVWIWGGGKKPSIPAFSELYGVKGSVISGVYIIKGVGRCIGLDVIDVPGATGYIDTNYEGKAEYAITSLKDKDFVLVHVEAPDEASHMGDIEMKIKAIEDFDDLVVGNVLRWLNEQFEESYKILVLPDHYTPVSLGIHTKEAVPFALYDAKTGKEESESKKKVGFDEISAAQRSSGRDVLEARTGDLMRCLFSNKLFMLRGKDGF